MANILEALNVRAEGTGNEVLVFAHGFGTDQSVWQAILPCFTLNYVVILFDLACSGSVHPESFDFQSHSTLHGSVDDLFNILDALHINRCVYVGHSMSAMIGMLASIRRPNLFTKLILVGASPRFLNDEGYNGGIEPAHLAQVLHAMQANYQAHVHGIAPLAVGADCPAAVQEFTRTLFSMRPDITLFVSRVAFYSDLREILGQGRVPCYIMQTIRDASVPASVAWYLQVHLGGRTTVLWLDTVGHRSPSPLDCSFALRQRAPYSPLRVARGALGFAGRVWLFCNP